MVAGRLEQVKGLAQQAQPRQVGQQGPQHRLGHAHAQDTPRLASLRQRSDQQGLRLKALEEGRQHLRCTAAASPWKRPFSSSIASGSQLARLLGGACFSRGPQRR